MSDDLDRGTAEEKKQGGTKHRRWLRRLGWIGVLLGVAFIFMDGIPGRLNSAGLTNLKAGMTLADVQAILGGPPGNYGGIVSFGEYMTLEGSLRGGDPMLKEKIWNDNQNRLEFYFDSNDKLVAWHKRAGYSRLTPFMFVRMTIQKLF